MAAAAATFHNEQRVTKFESRDFRIALRISMAADRLHRALANERFKSGDKRRRDDANVAQFNPERRSRHDERDRE